MPTATPKVKKLVDDLGEEFELQFKDVSYTTHQQGQITTPEGMALAEAIWWLQLKQKELETYVDVIERIEGYPIDVANALQIAVMEMFGIRELKSTPGFFSDTPPTFISVATGTNGERVEVFIGKFGLPGVEGSLESARDWNEALVIKIHVKQKSLPTVRKLMTMAHAVLATRSLYKGKAVRVGMTKQSSQFEERIVMTDPEFINTRYMPANLVLNSQTRELLEAALWAPIERTEQTRFYGVSVKRGILLEGPYGTGKSLTALDTARRAQDNTWTFLYLKNVNDLKRVYPFAARYAPSVIFAEDIDLLTDTGEDEETRESGIRMLNNVLDGMDNKESSVILVLTTNHVDKLPPSLLRPGRFDSIVTFTQPDATTAVELVRQYAGNDIDTDDFNGTILGSALAGKQPATIHEIVKRAKLYSQLRFDKDYRGPLRLSTNDILLSNESMTGHMRLLNKPEETKTNDMEKFGEIVGGYIVEGVRYATQTINAR